MTEDKNTLLQTLQTRFEKNMHRHKGMKWETVATKLEKADPKKIAVLQAMEETGGEPDVVSLGGKNDLIFVDSSTQSPKGRRSLCYDKKAWGSRKQHKPKDNAADVAKKMGVELLTEEHYRKLQEFDEFDTTTSSWIETPTEIRKLGGALFCDRRYDTVFTYHNGAESYYAARGFRGLLEI